MNAWVLHAPADSSGALRWGTSAAVVVALHAGIIALGIAWYVHTPPAGSPMATILVDLPPAPSSAAPQPQQMDAAPGPEAQQADAPSPPPEPPKQEAAQETSQPQIPSTPPQDKPVVAAPPEQKAESKPELPKPELPKPEPPKPVRVKPKHVETKKPSTHPPTPRTTAPPRAEQRAPAASARAGAAAGAPVLPAYRELLAAHLRRFQQYPPAAKAADEQGTTMLSFTVSRSGRVLTSRLAGSSGHPSLDAETLAMIRRAQPLPAFPPEMKQATASFTIPVHFLLR